LVFVVVLSVPIAADGATGYGIVRRGQDPALRVNGSLQSIQYALESPAGLLESEKWQLRRAQQELSEDLRLMYGTRRHEMLLETIRAQNTHNWNIDHNQRYHQRLDPGYYYRYWGNRDRYDWR
jgi:hypothetical protein